MQVNNPSAWLPNSTVSSTLRASSEDRAAAQQLVDAGPGAADRAALREKFDTFVGEAFYGQMLSAMRSTVGKPAYMHGGRAEEIFQGQLDQMMSQEMTKASASSFTGPMFELFALSRG